MNYILLKLHTTRKYIFLSMCLMFNYNHAEQFIYPIADFDHGNQLLLLCQKSLDCIELWIWDTTTKHATKGLSSFLIPANLQMVPSGKGFSFIDQGYIKIKEFLKRSPKTLPIYESIGLFSNMDWIDDETFYFVAREGDFFQIFQGDEQATIHRLTHRPVDALYPQKINAKLFYIERDMNNQVSIVTQSWNPVDMDTCNDALNYHVIVEPSSQQLCFLHMMSETEGFYIQAPTKKSTQNNCYEFSCYHLVQQLDRQWITEKLFNFQIPSKYIVGQQRLYESLERFLPNYKIHDTIYFVTVHEELHQLQLCTYDMTTKIIESIDNQFLHRQYNQQIFAPYIHDGKIHCGFIVPSQRNGDSLQNNFEIDGVQFELPLFQQK